MSLQTYAGFKSFIGPDTGSSPSVGGADVTLNAANSMLIAIGRVVMSDGSAHTLDTSGSIGWRSDATLTFANAGTTVVVGVGDADTGNGPPARVVNASNVATLDVKATFTGGGGGITNAAWQTSVMTSGSKVLTPGDLIAIVIQMTARGGSDVVQASYQSYNQSYNRPVVVQYTGSYTLRTGVPNFIISFGDGAYGWIDGTELFNTMGTRAFNSGSATKEYGQLYQFPFPGRVLGVYGFVQGSGTTDFGAVLYSDPLGSPVAERTASFDGNTLGSTGSNIPFREIFSTPYDFVANQPLGAVFKPTTANNITVYTRVIANAAHRVVDPWGANGYGISRASGAFANINSSLEHHYIGLIVSAYDGGSAGGGLLVNPGMRGGML